MTHGEEGLRYTEREVEVVAGHRVIGREVAVAFRWCAGCGHPIRVAGLDGERRWNAEHEHHGHRHPPCQTEAA